MNVENGAAEAANDTAQTNNPAEAQNEAQQEGQVEAGEGEQPEDEEEIDLGDERYRIPRKVKEAIAKPFLQDYTKKTTELSEGRKAFDAEKKAFADSKAAREAHFEQAAKVVSFNDQIAATNAQLAEYAKVDWQALYDSDQRTYHLYDKQARLLERQIHDLTSKRDSAARAWTDKEREFSETAKRESDNRQSKAVAEIAKLVDGWAPGNELDHKLSAYGNSRGFSNEEMSELAIRNPVFVRELNRLRVYDEEAKKKQTTQTFEQSQQAKPVTRVGSNGGSAARKTTDSSGDALSTAEWMKRESERLKRA